MHKSKHHGIVGSIWEIYSIFTSYAFGTSRLNFILVNSVEMTTRFCSASSFVPLVVVGIPITGIVKQLNTMEASPCDLSSSHMYLKDVYVCTIRCFLHALLLFHHLFDQEKIITNAFHEILGTFFKLLWAFDNLSSDHQSTVNDVLYTAPYSVHCVLSVMPLIVVSSNIKTFRKYGCKGKHIFWSKLGTAPINLHMQINRHVWFQMWIFFYYNIDIHVSAAIREWYLASKMITMLSCNNSPLRQM